MTNNPLVETVAKQLAANDAPPSANAQTWSHDRWGTYTDDVATTIRAIEDAGYRVVKSGLQTEPFVSAAWEGCEWERETACLEDIPLSRLSVAS